VAGRRCLDFSKTGRELSREIGGYWVTYVGPIFNEKVILSHTDMAYKKEIVT